MLVTVFTSCYTVEERHPILDANLLQFVALLWKLPPGKAQMHLSAE